MDAIKTIEVLRNLRDGDVLLVRVHDETPSDQIEAMHTALESVIVNEVTIIVTSDELVQHFRIMSLSDLVELKEQIEIALQLRMSSSTAEG